MEVINVGDIVKLNPETMWTHDCGPALILSKEKLESGDWMYEAMHLSNNYITPAADMDILCKVKERDTNCNE